MNTYSSGWPAPAKLNLFLHIVGRRADGYHLLQTVFQFVDFGDLLSFEINATGVIRRTRTLTGVPETDDLALRAARLLQQETGSSLGVTIELDKYIPMGGGLGGGSSDAATTLVALNHLWGLGLECDELAALGLRLGADVPVFVRGQAAWAEGIGEQLVPITLEEPWYLVIIPPCQISTQAIFAAPDLTRDSIPIKIRRFQAGQGENVCEPVVCRRYPEVAAALTWLSGYAPARMSGTGAAVFAAFADETAANVVLAKRPSGWCGFVAKAKNRSPLQDHLAKYER